MKHTRKVAAAAIFALMVSAAPAVSATTDADVLQQTQDRVQISELMWHYGRALDTLNADKYVQAFTADGAFGAVKGREALHKMIADLKKSRDDREAKGEKQGAMYHIETNEHIEFVDHDHARLHYYWLTVFAGPPGKLSANVAAVGNGVDDLVREDGKWLIKFRNVTPKDE